MSFNYQQRLTIIAQQSHSLVGFGRGIEREALRVLPDGKLSQKMHPYAFGSALCHSTITTDFAESLFQKSKKPRYRLDCFYSDGHFDR